MFNLAAYMKGKKKKNFPPHPFQNKHVSGLVVFVCGFSGSALPLAVVKMALLEKHQFIRLSAGNANFPNWTRGEVPEIPNPALQGSTRGSSWLALCPPDSFLQRIWLQITCKTKLSSLKAASWGSWAGGGVWGEISDAPGRCSNVLEVSTHDVTRTGMLG